MHRAAIRLILLGALILDPARAAAQGPLTLDEAIAAALARNPSLRGSTATEQASAARVDQARAGYLPRIDLVEGWQRGNHPVFVFSSLLAQRRFTAADFAIESLNHPDAATNLRAAIVLDQPIFDGGRTRYALRGARLDVELARLETEKVRQELRQSVIAAFGRVLAAQALRASAAAAVSAANEDLRRTVDRRDAGVETEANVLAFRVSLAESEARRVNADAEERVARASLGSLTGDMAGAERPLEPLPPREATPIDAPALETAALANRPEMKQAALRVEQARAARGEAQAGLWPQVAAQAGAEANGATFADRESAWSASVQVRWNLFAGGADAARVKEATAHRLRAEAEQDRLASAVRLEVRTAAAGHLSAVARDQASRQMVEQARESQRMIRDRYEAGLAPAGDVLRAAGLLAQAEAATVAAAVDVHVSAAALDRAIGRSGSH